MTKSILMLMKPEVVPGREPTDIEIVSEETLRHLGSFCGSGLAYSVREGQISASTAADMYSSWFNGDKKGLEKLYKEMSEGLKYGN